MRTILTALFLLVITNIITAQNHSVDTTFKSKNHTLHILIKDRDSNAVFITATYASHIALHQAIDSRGLAAVEFPDFNKDGYPDILLNYFGNNATYFLYLFDPVTRQYKSINGYMKYPDAVQLKTNGKFYYSYQRAGCADLNWVSDLFTIVKFKIIQLGHIYGQGCDFEVKANLQVIDIYKVSNKGNNTKQIAKLPYLKNIKKFNEKWNFIEAYWNKSYRKFG